MYLANKYKHILGEESSADTIPGLSLPGTIIRGRKADSALQGAREHGRRREMHPVRDLRKGEGRINPIRGRLSRRGRVRNWNGSGGGTG